MADAKTMPPLPPVDGYGARPEGHYSADQMREYARAYAAAPQPAASDVPHDVVRADGDGDHFRFLSSLEMIEGSVGKEFGATPAPSTPTEEALRAENAKWGRADLAKGLAALDGVTLHDVLTSSGDAANMANWREYLGRADDLLAHLSLAASTHSIAALSR